MSPSELRLEAPVGCSGRDVALRPGYAAWGGGGIIWSSGNKKRGDKDLTAVVAAGWRLRRLNLSVETEEQGSGAVRSLPDRVRSATHQHIATSRLRTGSTPTPPEHRPVWRNAGKARPTCAPPACVKETPSSSFRGGFSSPFFLDYWNPRPHHGFMDKVGDVVLLLLWSKCGLQRQVSTRSTVGELG